MKQAELKGIDETAEAKFHDEWAASVDPSKLPVEAIFESGSCPENRQILDWMGDLKGKRVLEIGCGLGEASVYFAKKGAIVTAVDLSEGMVQATRRLAELHGVSVNAVVVSASDLSALPDGEFDFAYAANLLHHVEIGAFLDGILGKIRPGGTFFSWDPIEYNPAIQFYRRLATQVRTKDEHPLRVADLRLIRSKFRKVETRFFWYGALLIFLKYFLVDRIDPNQQRYWKKIIDDAPTIGTRLDFLHRLDRLFFSWIPGVRWLAWNIVIRAEVSPVSNRVEGGVP